MSKPNILLIVTDQERARTVLPPGLVLPAHDRLRAAGVDFTDYHVNAVACSPSRSTIYTGQHIQHTRIYDNAGGSSCLDPARTPTIGLMLRQQGYRTAYAGKWHLSDPEPDAEGDYAQALAPFGFDLYHPVSGQGDSFGLPCEGARRDADISAWAGRWIAAQAEEGGSAPWFLSVNLINPHDIMFFDATGAQNRTRQATWAHMAGAPSIPPYTEDMGYDLPVSFGAGFANRPAVHQAFAEASDFMFGEIPEHDVAAWRRFQNYYVNCLRDVDARIGEVLDALDQASAASTNVANTVVILTSDHGEMAGAHGLRGKGPVAYRENFSVPLIIRHPDVTGPRQIPALSCALDLAPTLLGLAGLGAADIAAAYPMLRGYDLGPLISGVASSGPREDAGQGVLLNSSSVHASNPLTMRAHGDLRQRAQASGRPAPQFIWPVDYLDRGLRSFMRGYYDGRYRYARYFAPDDHHVPEDWATLTSRNDLELYDTRSDFHELDNLAVRREQYRDLILDLDRKLNALIAREVGRDDGSYLPPPLVNWTREGQPV